MAVYVRSYSWGELETLDKLKKLGEWVRETVSQVTMVFRVRKLLQSRRLMNVVAKSCVYLTIVQERVKKSLSPLISEGLQFRE